LLSRRGFSRAGGCAGSSVGATGSGLFWTQYRPWRGRTTQPAASNGNINPQPRRHLHPALEVLILLGLILLGVIVLAGILGG
jgi:hypothetical protein